MNEAKHGDTVKVHYTGRLTDGTVFDSSKDRDPLEFKLGEKQLIPGFESAVMGMAPGESKTVTVDPEQAYGPHHEEMVLRVGRDQVPAEMPIQLGDQFQLAQKEGQPIVVTVTELSEGNVTLDANHPLAGKPLTFEIELVAIG